MSLHVLLVEDDRQLRQTLQAALETHGYTVTGSASKADAQAVLRHHPQAIDLVILDLGLPDADGSELLSELRQQRQTPVLVISARHDDAGKVKLLDAGADDYLVKPFSVQELLARMRVSLRHRGLAVQTPVLHYRAQGLEVDVARHRVSLQGDLVRVSLVAAPASGLASWLALAREKAQALPQSARLEQLASAKAAAAATAPAPAAEALTRWRGEITLRLP